MAGRIGIRRVVFSLIIVLTLVATACSQVANVRALQQEAVGTWPRCVSGCTSNDVEINSVWLDVPAGNYTLGETVTGNVSMNLYFHRQNTYCIVVVADLYGGGVPQQTDWVSNIIGYHDGGGNYTYSMGTVNWTYGKLFEMRNVLVEWDQNDPKGPCPTDCSNYVSSKCYEVITVIVTTPLVVDFEFNEVCFCNSTTLTDKTTGGVKPYTWYWDFADGDNSTAQNATHHFDAADTYTVTLNVTDSDSPSTTASQSYNVTVNEKPTATASSNSPVCAGATIELYGGPGGMTSYSWTGPNGFNSSSQSPTIPNATTSNAGIYYLTVIDGGCTSDPANTTVVVNTKPTATASSNSPVCEGATIELYGGPIGMASYSWTGPNGFNSSSQSPTIPNATTSNAGTYSLTVIDGGCTSDPANTVVVVNTKPLADAGADAEITAGGSVVIGGSPTASGGTPPYTYSWTPTTGLNDASIDNPTASPAVNTTYTVTVTDSKGCTDSDDVTVTVTYGCCICGFVYRGGTTEPLAAWEVILEKKTNPWLEVQSTTTDANGKYCFCGLGDGEYRVSEVVKSGWNQVSPLPNEHLVNLPGGCCDPEYGPLLNFENEQSPKNPGNPLTVGWVVSPVNKLAVLAPWIALLALIVTSASLLAVRRRRA